MHLQNPYWHFDYIFSEEECDKIIEKGTSIFNRQSDDQNVGKVYADSLNKQVNKSARDCNIAWLDDRWIYEKIQEIVEVANQGAGWNWDVSVCERLQFTEYKVGGHYSWHADGGSDHPSAYQGSKRISDYAGKVRKISITINLSDLEDYDGGELMFSDPTYISDTFGELGETEPYTPKQFCGKGSAIVFPSFTMHKVSPVTRGTRYSLVTWVLGEPWK